MAAALLGHAACPLCGGQSRVTLSKNKLPVLTCSHCGIQLFARSERSDELIRDRIEQPAGPVREGQLPTAEAEPVRTDGTLSEGVPEDVREAVQEAVTHQGGGLMSSWFR